MLNVENKVIAITGASSGIGEATARFLAAKGAKVFLGARRIENLQAIAAEIQTAGGEVRFTALDVTQKEQLVEFLQFAQAQFGHLDVLVSNAGLMPQFTAPPSTLCDWYQKDSGRK
jgi:NADP-dependent 3-hydroxy acid dehydrogenase YdfG